MYKLIAMEEGQVQSEEQFKTFKELKNHLLTVDYFSWINEQEQSDGVELTELPSFEEVETVEDIQNILDEYNYSWWSMTLEVEK